jgi:hypothetical protein
MVGFKKGYKWSPQQRAKHEQFVQRRRDERAKTDAGRIGGDSGKSAEPVDPQELAGRTRTIEHEPASRQARREKEARAVPLSEPDADTLDAWTNLLAGIHAGIGGLVDLLTGEPLPEAELDPSEAKELSRAAGRVARWYKLPKMAEKSADWMNLASVLMKIEGPRVAAYRLRKKMEADEHRAQAPVARNEPARPSGAGGDGQSAAAGMAAPPPAAAQQPPTRPSFQAPPAQFKPRPVGIPPQMAASLADVIAAAPPTDLRLLQPG